MVVLPVVVAVACTGVTDLVIEDRGIGIACHFRDLVAQCIGVNPGAVVNRQRAYALYIHKTIGRISLVMISADVRC